KTASGSSARPRWRSILSWRIRRSSLYTRGVIARASGQSSTTRVAVNTGCPACAGHDGRVRGWRSGLRSLRQGPALVERREAARRRSHQEGVALAEDALDVGRVDVRMADRDLVLLAGVDDVLHGVEHLRVLVLAREAELLAQVAFADQDQA